MKLFASYLGAAAIAAASFAAQGQTTKPDVAKGAALYGQVCVACHAADGNSNTPINPKLARQHPEYLVKQLQEFKSGKRENAVMKGFASTMSDADMRNVAYWLASQKATAGVATQKDLVSLGERIYRGGIPDRQIAACTACHAANGSGIPAQYPRLSGQHCQPVGGVPRRCAQKQRPNGWCCCQDERPRNQSGFRLHRGFALNSQGSPGWITPGWRGI
jgi:cytochrome c553